MSALWLESNAAGERAATHLRMAADLTEEVANLASDLAIDPVEMPGLTMLSSSSPNSVIEARLVSPCPINFALNRVSPRVHVDRPLEIELVAVDLGTGAGAAASVASWMSSHAVLSIVVDTEGQPSRHQCAAASANPSTSGWAIRALVRPSSWVGRSVVTIVSLTLAGRPLPCDCLPATVPVGYNHSQTHAGRVYAAAKAGDTSALQIALDDGGSTEETGDVSAALGLT